MIEVLKQMVDALETYGDKHRKTYLLEGAWDEEITKGNAAIQAGKQALAQLALDAKAENARELGLDYEQEPVAWELGVVNGVVTRRPVARPQRTEQEPVAYLCEPDANGLFGLPTPDKGCKDCFPVYRHSQRTEERNFCSRCGKRLGGEDSIHTCTPPQRTEGRVCCQQYDICLEPCTSRGRHLAQRTWAGLAKEDRLCAKYMQDAPDGIEAVIDYIEAKLKEKNT